MSTKPSLSSADVSADAQPGATEKAEGTTATAIASDEQIAEFSASPQRWWGLLVLAVGLGIIVLDGTIVGVSLPTI
ncbi:MFS transporter, partial [Corynebacterium amycolatum]